jgi:hypothetical protein
MFRVRGARRDYLDTHNKWKAIFNALQDSGNAETGGLHLPGVIYIQTVHYGPMVFTDDKSRVNMTGNFRAMLRPSTV